MKNPRRLYDPIPPAGGGGGGTPPPANGALNPPPPAGAPPNNMTTNPPANEHWTSKFEGLDDKVKTHPSLQPFKTPADAIKAYTDVQPLLGRDKAPIPTDWTDAAQVKAFNDKIGVPAKAEEYKLKDSLVKTLPKEYTVDEARVAGFEKMAHDAGLTPRQAQQLLETYTKQEIEQVTGNRLKTETDRANTLNTYKQERGSQFDLDLAQAHKALINYGDEDTLKALNESGFGDDPRFIKLFAKIGATLKEGTAHTSGAPGSLQSSSVDSARIRKAEMMADQGFMRRLENAGDPGHRDAVAEWQNVTGRIPAGR